MSQTSKEDPQQDQAIEKKFELLTELHPSFGLLADKSQLVSYGFLSELD